MRLRKQPLTRSLVLALSISALPLTATAAATPTPAAGNGTAQRLTNLKTRGGAEIDRRQANLNTALAKLQASTKLTAADKDALVKQIQDEQAGLTSLRDKLSADTTLAAARADVASIVTDYRVYALMLPKVRLVAALDRNNAALTALTDLGAVLQTRISAAKSNGKDVAQLQARLDNLKTQLSTTSGQTSGLAAQLLALQPSDYNANHAALVSYRQTLATAQASLNTARADAAAIIAGLKSL